MTLPGMHQISSSDEPMTDSDFMRLDFDVATPTDYRRTDQEIINVIKELFVEVGKMRKELHDHVKDEKSVLANAFPDGDPDGHRRAHDAWIKKAEDQAVFWEKLKTSVVTWGVIGICVFIAGALWTAFLRGPK